MKPFIVIPFLLCAVALSPTTAAESYNNSPSQGQSNSRHSRQIEVNQLRVCQGIISQEECNNGLVQETVNLAVQCNLLSTATLVRDNCRQNSAGDYCAQAVTYAVNDIQTIRAECSADPSFVCTARCKNLLMLIRSQLGCCLNLVFNNSANSFHTPGPFQNSVWTRCGVEPITEECTQSTIELPQAQLDTTCSTLDIFAERAGVIRCSRQHLQPVIDNLMDSETCQIYAEGIPESCGVDESGTPCYEQSDTLTMAFLASENACGNVTTCNPSCAAALRNFTSAGGCCINNVFNGTLAGITSARYRWMSYEFWQQCGVETPGLCEIRLNGEVRLNGAATLGGTANILAISSAILLLLVMLNLY